MTNQFFPSVESEDALLTAAWLQDLLGWFYEFVLEYQSIDCLALDSCDSGLNETLCFEIEQALNSILSEPDPEATFKIPHLEWSELPPVVRRTYVSICGDRMTAAPPEPEPDEEELWNWRETEGQ
jgi:hypothetical protein